MAGSIQQGGTRMSKFLAAIAAVGALAIAAPASAAVTVVNGSCASVSDANGCLFQGNIAPNTVLETQNAYNAYNNTHPGANPDITLNYLFKSDDPGMGFTLTSGAGTSSGSWATPGYLIDFIAVKSANNFVLYKLSSPVSSGSWDTLDIPFNRNPHELSHLAFFGSVAAVPEPATWAMMLLGFFGLGAALRSRRAAAFA